LTKLTSLDISGVDFVRSVEDPRQVLPDWDVGSLTKLRCAREILRDMPLPRVTNLRSLTHDSWSLPVVAELVELTYLRLSCDEEGSMAPQLAGLHHLKELSYTTGSCDHVLGISTAAEVTKLEISYARVLYALYCRRRPRV